MARLGTLRVNDVLDYDRDIKGKGLIRLRAGVGAGKNYWVRHLPEQYPQLQILMITSRKNVAAAEAIKLGADNRIHTSQLINTADREWYTDFPGSLIVCTNAYIEYFLKNIYDSQKPETHLWNKFDVIFIDEAHALTSDASFADSPFHVVQFIRHVRRLNPRCDIVMMSGTQEPIDWFFSEEYLTESYTTIDLYDRCIHLVPDIVSMMKKEVTAESIFKLWSHSKRLIYFVNSVAAMADLIIQLKAFGIPEEDMAIAYTESQNEDKLPMELVAKKEAVRNYLVENSHLPEEVKILITTSQNKEGVSIEDDDIKYMFSESHNKADLEQMAGRVRGNPITGTGLHALIVIYDADDHWINWSFLECELDRKLDGQVGEILDRHIEACVQSERENQLGKDIKAIEKKHRYLRYDYIQKDFSHFTGREKCEVQTQADRHTLDSYMELYDEILFYYSDGTGYDYVATGHGELGRSWFPYSKLYHAPGRLVSPKEAAATEFLAYLRKNEYLEVEITSKQVASVMDEIYRLIDIYGYQELGFDQARPARLKPALRRFNMSCSDTSHHNRNKIIHLSPQD